MLPSGEWVPGHKVDGWSPLEQPNWKTCIKRKNAAIKFGTPRGLRGIKFGTPGGLRGIKWFCVKYVK